MRIGLCEAGTGSYVMMGSSVPSPYLLPSQIPHIPTIIQQVKLLSKIHYVPYILHIRMSASVMEKGTGDSRAAPRVSGQVTSPVAYSRFLARL
jgi:hypothetical protein